MAKEKEKEINPDYWNGKTSNHPIIQEMIRMDNTEFQMGPHVEVPLEEAN